MRTDSSCYECWTSAWVPAAACSIRITDGFISVLSEFSYQSELVNQELLSDLMEHMGNTSQPWSFQTKAAKNRFQTRKRRAEALCYTSSLLHSRHRALVLRAEGRHDACSLCKVRAGWWTTTESRITSILHFCHNLMSSYINPCW